MAPFSQEVEPPQNPGRFKLDITTVVFISLPFVLVGLPVAMHYANPKTIIAAIPLFGLLVAIWFQGPKIINVHLDASPQVREFVSVEDSRKFEGRGRNHYFLTIRRSNQTSRFEIEVPESVYRQSEIGTTLEIELRQGHLGNMWASALRLAPSSKSNHVSHP
ncbi:MAG TPA: hypothetical protein PLE48_15305, partial [Thiobacillus sp.]|nr:hypothetical protein [Thiobacillus sp.]HQT71771.1 hypothetical protein [Thiobacillus sp.]